MATLRVLSDLGPTSLGMSCSTFLCNVSPYTLQGNLIVILILNIDGQDHPDHNVPKSGVVTLIDGSKVNLGQWLKSQRKLRRNGKLQPQREAMLQSLIDKGTLYWYAHSKHL